MTVFVGNTNLLELNGLKVEQPSEAFINDAIVQVTITKVTADGEQLESVSWPLELEYVAGSDGDYRLALGHDLPFEAKKTYVAIIAADAGSSPFERYGYWEFKFKPRTRTGDPTLDDAED